MCESSQGFVPPFCPNPHCPFHRDPGGWRFKRDGAHFRRCDQRRVQRYRCSQCRRSFSTQTFSTTYWLKRPDLLEPLLRLSLACAGFRQLARSFSVSPSTVALQLGRAGRHATLYHELHRPRTNPREPLVLDGFETFEKGQYWPTHLNTVVGAESWFVYATTVSELRRKGRMRPRQRARVSKLEIRYGRPHPRDIERGSREALALALPNPGPACVRSDEHRQYPPAIAALPGREIRHETTSSRLPRTSRNPLFAVNLYHGLLRHDGGNHKRETIAFSKRNQSMLWREAIHRVWRNWVKQVSERRGGGTPAMQLGLANRPIGWDEILAERLFPTRIPVPAEVARSYFGRIPTRSIPAWRAHTLYYAI